MNITISQATGRVPIAILGIQGDLDASNYQELIAQATELYRSGTKDILVDLSDTNFVSSSGLVALHSIALLLRGEQPPDPEAGWAARRAFAEGLGSEKQQHIRLLNPQPKVDRTLEEAGFKEFLEIHTDRATAIASF